jgi:bacterioferritin (cytochrome b1)
MGARLLPRNLPELFSYSLAVEREATKRFAELERFLRGVGVNDLADEFEKLGREEREQYDLIMLGTSEGELPELGGWELAWHFTDAAMRGQRAPRSTREALVMALAFERRVQAFYADVAENARSDAVRAFAADMSNDEQRHVRQLEALLERESGPYPVDTDPEASDGVPPA